MIKKLIFTLSILALASTTPAMAQVTIGSGQTPNKGALLDLKTETDGTSKKGMILPRVKLDDVDKLKMGTNEILDTDNGGDQYKKHAGLVVFNISGEAIPRCAPIPDGLYVWDGAQWTGINTPETVAPASLDVGAQTIFNLPSGRDARPLTTQSFTATWTPATLPYTNTPHATFGGVSFSGINALPATPLNTSPMPFDLLPDAMTTTEVAANPFRTKISTLTFNATNECGAITPKSITVNQTNKALTLAITSYNNPTSGTYYNTIQSNVQWQFASMIPNNITSVFSGFMIGASTLSIGTITNWGKDDNTGIGTNNNLRYSITINASKSRYSTLFFADTENPKRFADVTVSVVNCSGTSVNPKMSEWAAMAGFAGVAEIKLSDADDIAKKINIANTTTGIAWHRDQDNNIFLSSSFDPTDITGNTERWMITNLAARNYSPNTTHYATPPRVLNGPGFHVAGWAYPSNIPKPSPNQTEIDPTNPTNYNNNPRLGLHYNWDGATAGRGDGGGGSDEGGVNHTKIQGICPDGWYLPSDYDWTVLENKIIYRTATFSSIADINAGNANTLPQGGAMSGTRGTLHGKAMKETCEPYATANQGTSNTIGTNKRPGFEILLAGVSASAIETINYGVNSNLWSSSRMGTTAWQREFGSGNSAVPRTYGYRSITLMSVRCKKN